MCKPTPLLTPQRWHETWLVVGGRIRFENGPGDTQVWAFEAPNPNALDDAGCREVARLTWLREQEPLRSALADYLRDWTPEW
jgi:hypothetical protein